MTTNKVMKGEDTRKNSTHSRKKRKDHGKDEKKSELSRGLIDWGESICKYREFQKEKIDQMDSELQK